MGLKPCPLLILYKGEIIGRRILKKTEGSSEIIAGA
jgi:hypothetical protein